MAWQYSTALISPVPANQGGVISYINSVLAVISNLSGWTISQPGTSISSAVPGSARGLITHTPTGARLSFAASALANGANFISAANSYTGVAISEYDDGRLFAAYFPSDETGTVPAINSGTPLLRQFVYSAISNTRYMFESNSRIHVWADGDKIILAVQRNTSITTINDVFFAGPLATSLINAGDTEDQVQWVMPAFTAATNSATGAGQARNSTGTRILSMTPIVPNYLLDVNRQSGAAEFTLLPIWYAASTASVATGNGIKGLIDPDAVVAGSSAVSLRATVDGETRVHIGAGYYMPWDAIYSPML